MRVERTPIEPTPEDAAAARQRIMDALAVLYPGWTFTAAVALAIAGEHMAIASVGTAYNNVEQTAGALLFGGKLGRQLAAAGGV